MPCFAQILRIIQSTISKDVRQGWNYKPARVGFSSKKADLVNKNTNLFEDSFSFRQLLLGMNSPYLMKDSQALDYANHEKLDFEEFCVAAKSLHQLEGMESWEQHARHAYELFEMDVNKPIMFEGTCLCILVSFKWNLFCNLETQLEH
ncbi:hypothetical protein CMV_017355 [Castanea mollissima]|uniref:Uncharacterized protein n=1 Tax=Castanea mollissima TaxID=60419 RepID=A0A8J4R4T2_9ROSI|nr:hypothetical protein CMV_017355 [Castanea mollissima]